MAVGINEDTGAIHTKKLEREAQAPKDRVVVTQVEVVPETRIEVEAADSYRVTTPTLRSESESLIVQVDKFSRLKNCRVGLDDGDVANISVSSS